MKVPAIQNVSLNSSFTSSIPYVVNTEKILLYDKNIKCDFRDNTTVAYCVHRVARFFAKALGDKSLPDIVNFEPIREKAYGTYSPSLKKVSINSNCECFGSEEALKKEMKASKRIFFLPNRKSSSHYLRTFAHEFGHNAHYSNLEQRGNVLSFILFNNLKLPNVVGRLISKFKLGEYSVVNLDEFMAERIAKDICEEESKAKPDMNKFMYGDLFERKWNCRYISPQAYLDFYTQQIWNGDLEASKRVVKDIEDLFTSLDNGQIVYAKNINRFVEKAALKKKSLLGYLDYFFGRNLNTPQKIDEINSIKIKKQF